MNISGLVILSAILTSRILPGQRPARPLGPILTTSATIFGGIFTVRQLSDGRVLVNDPGHRNLVMLDESLRNAVTILDSTSGQANSYLSLGAALVPMAGDSTLVFERRSQSGLVLDPRGKIGRTMSLPPGAGYTYLGDTSRNAHPAISPAFGLLFGAPIARTSGPWGVIGMNLSTHGLDTLIRFNLEQTSPPPLGSDILDDLMRHFLIHVLFATTLDEWAMTSDGAIAVLRGREYRLDWINVDGSASASPRIPFEWVRWTDVDKIRIADSVNRSFDNRWRSELDRWLADSAAHRPLSPRPVAGTRVMRPDEVPDYRPAVVRPGPALLADADTNVWIRPNLGPDHAGTAYDIVNRRGEVIDRVLVPPERRIVGFGPHGVVYLVGYDAGQAFLQRVRVR